jgi:hypothetical protein
MDKFFITESNKIKVFECLDSISIKELYSRNLPLHTEHLIEACHIYVLGMSIGVEGTFSDQTSKNIYDSVQLVSWYQVLATCHVIYSLMVFVSDICYGNGR